MKCPPWRKPTREANANPRCAIVDFNGMAGFTDVSPFTGCQDPMPVVVKSDSFGVTRLCFFFFFFFFFVSCFQRAAGPVHRVVVLHGPARIFSRVGRSMADNFITKWPGGAPCRRSPRSCRHGRCFPSFHHARVRSPWLPCWQTGCTFLPRVPVAAFKPCYGEHGFSTYTVFPGWAGAQIGHQRVPVEVIGRSKRKGRRPAEGDLGVDLSLSSSTLRTLT